MNPRYHGAEHDPRHYSFDRTCPGFYAQQDGWRDPDRWVGIGVAVIGALALVLLACRAI